MKMSQPRNELNTLAQLVAIRQEPTRQGTPAKTCFGPLHVVLICYHKEKYYEKQLNNSTGQVTRPTKFKQCLNDSGLHPTKRYKMHQNAVFLGCSCWHKDIRLDHNWESPNIAGNVLYLIKFDCICMYLWFSLVVFTNVHNFWCIGVVSSLHQKPFGNCSVINLNSGDTW